MGKRYYLAVKFLGNEIKRDVWHCSQRTTKELAKMYDFLYPLDSKPRKNIDIREGA